MSNNAELFDESRATGAMDLYSRQIGTFGVETMKNLTKLRVLVIGLKGVGIETAKNLILAGPGAVTIHDNAKVEVVDLGTNFYFNETKIGQTRSEAALEQLKELNPYVEVTAHTGELSPDFIQTFGAVIITDHLPVEEIKRINDITHHRKANDEAAPILLLLGLTNGVTASIFADFGPEHKITDLDGEPAKINVIEQVTVEKDKEGKAYVVIKVNAAQHKLDDDSIVQISDVEGMVELNKLGQTKITRIYKTMMREKGKPREILVTNKLRIDAPDIETWGAYKSGGMISEIKPSKVLKFSTFNESLTKPTTELDMGFVRHPHEDKMYAGRGAQLHFARLALWEFDKKKKRLPRLHNQDDANELVEIAKEILAHHKTVEGAVTVDELDVSVLKNISLYAAVELPGLTAFLGGVLAQEVIKKFGKYTPIHQWIHIDYFELLASEVPGDATPLGSRHDNQIAVFGKGFQDKLEKQRWFMVGCGALGCEYLKGFALMGLGSNGGVLYVTDMDTIEVSNLSRQFLFRRDNVGKLKSQTAAAAAKRMNPKMNIEVSDVPVGPDTENKFTDTFWSKLDGVCNALDNIKAREYTDSKCVFFEKPLLESGTLGTKANSEMVIPHKTKSYAQHEAGGEEEAIPMCTLRNFPHLIEHCIEWSRAMFTDLFESPAASFNKFIKNPAEFFVEIKKQKEAEALDVLEHITKFITFFSGGANIEACIRFAFNIFISQFRDRILNLITAFPEDSTKTDENGVTTAFWSGSKRFPRGFEFNPDDEFHFSFVYNCANLYASVFKLSPVRDQAEFKKILLNMGLKAPAFQPDKKFMSQVQSEVKEEEKKDGEKNTKKEEEFTDEERLNKLLDDLKTVDTKTLYELNKAEFEKDDDTNFHIDFITSTSNMRALNYKLQTATRHKCKMIAGRIIPAVATTTAMITGLVEMELYKLVLQLPVDKFCNSNINLAVSDFKLFEPVGPKKAKEAYDPEEDEVVIPVPDGWSIWDKVIIDKGDLTVEELVNVFPSIHHGCTLSFLFFKNDNNAFWLDFPITNEQKNNNAKNFNRKISEIYAERFGAFPDDKYYIPLNAAVKSKEDKPASVPPIIFIFRKL